MATTNSSAQSPVNSNDPWFIALAKLAIANPSLWPIYALAFMLWEMHVLMTALIGKFDAMGSEIHQLSSAIQILTATQH